MPRGFAAMDPEKQREIARKGGQAAHSKGTAHEFSSTEAKAAGKKGGQTVGRNKAHMAEIGRLGGTKSGQVRAVAREAAAAPAPKAASKGKGRTKQAPPSDVSTPAELPVKAEAETAAAEK